jgi:CBS domain-containing protein
LFETTGDRNSIIAAIVPTLVLQHLLKPEFARKLCQPAHKTNQLEETAMQITTILNAKGHDVITISPDATVKDLAALLREKKIGAIVVSRDGKKIDGIVSERDVVHRLTDFGPKYLSVAVKEIMTAQVVTCSPDDTVDSCMELMSGRRIRHLPVARNGKLEGVVSIGDIVKAKIQEIHTEAESLKQYIAG